MPAPEQRVVNCPCGTRLLLRWTWSIGSAIYPVRCPDCDAEHQLHATSPIEVYRHDSKGNREYVTRSVERRPFKISNRCSSRITCSTVGSVFKTFCLGFVRSTRMAYPEDETARRTSRDIQGQALSAAIPIDLLNHQCKIRASRGSNAARPRGRSRVARRTKMLS